jgi:1,4-dihydroxy-2-naphthoyl-CoA synthase
MDDLAPDLIVTAEGPIRLIELNRPEQLNAAREALHRGLAGVWDRLAADDRVRAVVLTGRGRAFSAGGDFHVMTRVQRDEAFREQNIAEARSIIAGMTALGTERDSMHSPEHVAIVAKLVATSSLHGFAAEKTIIVGKDVLSPGGLDAGSGAG